MKRIFFISFIIILAIISCDKDEEITTNDKLSIMGTWNKDYLIRYNTEGDIISEESFDTIRIEKLSIDDLIIQSMHIDTSNSFYFLMYSSYVFENGNLQRHPDSLIDINMDKHYWNPEDSLFGTFPVRSYPFESAIEQTNNNEFIENRVFENGLSLDIIYNRLNEISINLESEFEDYSNTLKVPMTGEDKGIVVKSNSGDFKTTPVYNNVYKSLVIK